MILKHIVIVLKLFSYIQDIHRCNAMEGGERIEYVEEEVEHTTITISQPQVIVERVTGVVVEEAAAEDEHQNGTEEEVVEQVEAIPAGAPVTLDDIIADAVGTDNNGDMVEEAVEEESTKMDGVEEEQGTAAEGDDGAVKEEAEDEEPVTPARRKEEQSLDLNQCRCCKSREDLQDIFEPLKRDQTLPLSTIIVKLCNKLTITKRDHLPNVICKNCVYKLEIAWEFREQCEKTDKELRASLPRSQNKLRKRTDYTLIDYASSSGDDAGENVDDEDEFKLSDEVDEATASDSDPEVTEIRPRRRGRPPKATKAAASPAPARQAAAATPKSRGRPRKDGKPTGYGTRAPIAYVEAKEESESEDESDSEDDRPIKQAKKVCPKCRVVTVAGVAHKCKMAGASPGRPPARLGTSPAAAAFTCSFCAEKFATHPLYMNHQQLHTNFQNANTCVRCHTQFANKVELRKHQSGVRCQKATKSLCKKCGRVLGNATQLAIHLRTKCQPPAGAGAIKKELALTPKKELAVTPKKEQVSPKKEKSLFKFVAPTTSTYWSDSFSD